MSYGWEIYISLLSVALLYGTVFIIGPLWKENNSNRIDVGGLKYRVGEMQRGIDNLERLVFKLEKRLEVLEPSNKEAGQNPELN